MVNSGNVYIKRCIVFIIISLKEDKALDGFNDWILCNSVSMFGTLLAQTLKIIYASCFLPQLVYKEYFLTPYCIMSKLYSLLS